MYAPSCDDWTVFNARLMVLFSETYIDNGPDLAFFFIRIRVQTTIHSMETHPIASSRRYTDD